MQIIENSKIKEKLYTEKLKNGLTIMVIPKKTRKKFIIWGTKFGSIDNKFIAPGEKDITVMPDGIAHYLEHKLFEQESGKNSLDTLSALGVDANAYTTNNHTAYLYECTDNFYEALDEFMNYVQSPYFTDENVNKERGIIEQEIMMYDDYPEWVMYMNAMKAMYKNNEINVDVAGTKETIAEIDKEKLYKIYNSFYKPSNMIIVVSGDFEPTDIINILKSKITMNEIKEETKRIYNSEPDEIVKSKVQKNMDISMPCFMIGYKDNNFCKNKVKRDIAIDIISNVVLGNSTEFFKKLYEDGKILSEPSMFYEFAETYSHVLIQGQTNFVDEVIFAIEDEFEKIKNNGINDDDFERSKKKIYGELVKSYNDVSAIANSFLSNYFKNINPFDYFEEFECINKEYVEGILKEIFNKEKRVISIINPN